MSSKATESDITTLAIVIMFPIISALLVPILLWQGWAASILWGWFIVPTFGAPAITISQAAGVTLVLGLLRFKLSAPKDDTSWTTKIIALVIGPPMVVALGWVVKWTAL